MDRSVNSFLFFSLRGRPISERRSAVRILFVFGSLRTRAILFLNGALSLVIYFH